MLDLASLHMQQQQQPSSRRSSSDSSSSQSIRNSRESASTGLTHRWQDSALLKALSEIQLDLQQGTRRSQPEATTVLVCSSADEADEAEEAGAGEERTVLAANLDSTKLWNFVPRKSEGRRLQNSDSPGIALTCVEPNFGFVQHSPKHSNTHAASRNDTAHHHGIVSEAIATSEIVPASEDEDSDTTTIWTHVEDAPQACSRTSSPHLPEKKTGPDTNLEWLRLPTPESDPTAPDNRTGQELLDSGTADLIRELQSQVDSTTMRSYPLRQRTFQQQKPYTADKQQHARLIGSRGISHRSSRTDEYAREERALLRLQDDEDDSDYEERAPRIAEHDLISGPNRTPHTIDPDMDFFLQDLDEDDLPTAEQLRRQLRPQEDSEMEAANNRHRLHQPPSVKLPTSLSIRARKRLQQIAMQRLQPLEPLDAESLDAEPLDVESLDALSKRITSTYRHRRRRSPTPVNIEDTPGISPRASPEALDSSDSEVPQILAEPKKTKKHRQHVLPMVFFKRNLLPEDAAALRSLRSKKNRSESPEAGHGAGSTPIQLAHHAKRRIGSANQSGHGLSDFMARLAQDRSESEEEPSRRHFDSDSDVVENRDFSGYMNSPSRTRYRSPPVRPTLEDTEAFQPETPLSETMDYENLNPPRSIMISSDPEKLDSTDDGADDGRWRHQSYLLVNAPKHSKQNGTTFRGERQDMIDRMIVRPSRNSQHTQRSKGQTTAPRSAKRRRLSNNTSTTKVRRSSHGSSMPTNHRNSAANLNSRSRHLFRDRIEDTENDWALSDEAMEFQDHQHATDHEFMKEYGSDVGSYHQYSNPDSNPDLSDEDFATEDPWPIRSINQKARRQGASRGYSNRRDNGGAPTHRTRPLSRSKVVPRTHRIAPARPRSSNQGAAPDRTKKRARPPQAKATRTLQSHLTTWCYQNSAQSRPQFLNRPVFLPAERNSRTHHAAQRSNLEPPSRPEPENPPDDYHMPDQPWDEYDQSNPSGATTALAPALPASRPNISAALKTVVQNTSDSPVYHASDDLISNRLYFSQDTYIGRGMLSRVIRFLSDGSAFDFATSDLRTSAVFFGKPFTSEWSNPARLEMDLGAVALELKRRFHGILDASQDNESENRLDRTELAPSLRALENMTILLMDVMRVSSGPARIMVWNVFRYQVVRPMKELVDGLKTERWPSAPSSAAMWLRWALITWNAIADTTMVSDMEEMDATEQAAQSLLEVLFDRSNDAFFAQLARIQDRSRASSSVISGQDVLELWVCTIQVLDKMKEIRSSPGFWPALNRIVCRSLIEDRGTGRTGDDSTTAGEATTTWQGRANGAMTLLQELCRLYQFGRDGNSDASIQVHENWELVLWLLQNSWLHGPAPGGPEAERRLRRFLVFCHSRIWIWRWSPNAPVLVHVYRYFAGQGFQDMPSERGYRLPEFLKRMITQQPSASMQPLTKGASHAQPFSKFDPDMELVERLDKHDRCFEIFLKILARTIHAQVRDVYKEDQAENAVTTPSAACQADTLAGATPIQYSPDRSPSRADQIKTCKRFLSSISPALVMTIASDGSSEHGYSTLCNLCNLVLTIALLVPDFIRPSTVGQLRSLLNYEQSDDASRRIMLESVFYLGVIWDRQGRSMTSAERNVRTLDKIMDFFYGRIDDMCQELEGELSEANSSASYVLRSKRQAPIASLIETTISYVTRLLNNGGDTATEQEHLYPALECLDQRLGRFFNPEVPYPPELRLQALGVVESFLERRLIHVTVLQRLEKDKAQSRAQQSGTGQAGGQIQDQGHNPGQHQPQGNVRSRPVDDADDGFSSLDYDQIDFDDSELFNLSQRSESGTPNGAPALASTPAPVPVLAPTLTQKSGSTITLPLDGELAKILLSWVYPSMATFVKARHQALQDEQRQQLQARTASMSNLIQNSGDIRKAMAAARGTVRDFSPISTSFSTTSVPAANLTSISPQGIRRVLSVYADCNVILLDQQILKMEQARGLFKRESWINPWIQHWRLQDELVWATRLAECNPQLLLKHEDMFLDIWFSTISVPVQEVTVQHRLLRALLNWTDGHTMDVPSHTGSSISLYPPLLKDLPIAHRDYQTKTPHRNSNVPHTIDQSLLLAEQDSKLLQEFKESRLQLLAKVLSNIGEHYLHVRPVIGSTDQKAFYVAHGIKTRLQSFLGLLLNQIKKDYERLESRQMVKENIKHVELAHQVVGHVIQHCGLILQSSQLAGPHDSVLNFLTSSRTFPQPRLDGVYVHQKIRGYAYLYQAGERQFFRDMLEMVMSYLKRIGNVGSPCVDSVEAAGSAGSNGPDLCLGLRVVDGGTTVYGEATLGHGLQSIGDSHDGIHGLTDKRSSLLRSRSSGNVHGQAAGSVIQSLFAKQANKQQSPQELSDEALWILTSSLRNVALEPENKKHWNTAMGSFRTMALVSILRPLLTAFLGPDGQRGYCALSLSALSVGEMAAPFLPQRPSLIMAAVPATRWLVSLVEALVEDMAALDPRSTNLYARNGSTAAHGLPMLKAFEGFQRETSTMFAPLLQCLAGSLDLISDQYLNQIRVRLGDLTVRQNEGLLDAEERFSDDDRNATRALHLSGEVLKAIGAIAKVARKIRTEQAAFYDRNLAWRESLLELVEFALSRSIDVMMALGGPLQDAPDAEDDGVFGGGALDPDERLWVSDSVEPAPVSLLDTDRISRAQVAATLESSLQEYLSGQTQFAQFGEVVHRQLQNAPSLEGWACDVFSETEHLIEKGPVHHQQQQQHRQQHWGGLRTRQRVLWRFVRSFLDYCHAISMLDAGLHCKVLEAVGVLLRPPSQAQVSSGMGLYQVPRWDSAWHHMLHHAKDSTTSSLDHLRQCLSVEWRLFLVRRGMSSALPIPAASSVFV
ncbi:hypothetical protein BGZ67_007936 [Mortierella alpina]|nr:hypothetical protein BGZ67_007936 [Mortierella alpina]